MKEEIIDGIKYRLDEDALTAEVIELKDALEHDETKLTADKLMKMMFNDYDGDIVIPEKVESEKLPYCVTSIGDWAFELCTELTSITIPKGVTNIGSYAFFACKSLKVIALPESVTCIGDSAFNSCDSLTSITLPASITSIGKCAFLDCDSLISITYQGNIAQWEEIELSDDWNDEVPAKVVHCTDGDVEI